MHSPSPAPLRRSSSRRRSTRGFTLTEILIAIALIVMVVSLAVVELGGILGKGSEQVAGVFVNETLETPLMTYRINTGNYPSTEQGLNALVVAPSGVNGWKGPYVKEIPLDPWQKEYQYSYPGQKNGTTRPDIWSTGPDGANGTPDDIGNWKAAQP